MSSAAFGKQFFEAGGDTGEMVRSDIGRAATQGMNAAPFCLVIPLTGLPLGFPLGEVENKHTQRFPPQRGLAQHALDSVGNIKSG